MPPKHIATTCIWIKRLYKVCTSWRDSCRFRNLVHTLFSSFSTSFSFSPLLFGCSCSFLMPTFPPSLTTIRWQETGQCKSPPICSCLSSGPLARAPPAPRVVNSPRLAQERGSRHLLGRESPVGGFKESFAGVMLVFYLLSVLSIKENQLADRPGADSGALTSGVVFILSPLCPLNPSVFVYTFIFFCRKR